MVWRWLLHLHLLIILHTCNNNCRHQYCKTQCIAGDHLRASKTLTRRRHARRRASGASSVIGNRSFNWKCNSLHEKRQRCRSPTMQSFPYLYWWEQWFMRCTVIVITPSFTCKSVCIGYCLILLSIKYRVHLTARMLVPSNRLLINWLNYFANWYHRLFFLFILMFTCMAFDWIISLTNGSNWNWIPCFVALVSSYLSSFKSVLLSIYSGCISIIFNFAIDGNNDSIRSILWMQRK